MTVYIEDLVGLKELAGILHVPYETIGGWDNRRATTGFPDPILHLSMGRLWNTKDVVTWWLTWESPMNTAKHVAKAGHVDRELIEALDLTELDRQKEGNNGQHD